MNSSFGFELACAELRPEPALAVPDVCEDASCDQHNAAKLMARKKQTKERPTGPPLTQAFTLL
jgi:hypothetical protein